jgi:exodeoxyribonuclease VII large subunit
VEGAFVPLWVRGEISDFKAHRNGHWYFCLRDQVAQVRCVMWARDARRLPALPDDGMQVVALGQVSVYAARGDVQLVVKAMEAQGDGLWRKALDQTRAKLLADGLLDPARKRALPKHPRRVAIITSPDGAALHDIIAVARRRSPLVELVVVPAKVQGDGAAEELRAALERVARWGDVDVVIIGRGGGAREDLWAFNDERLARAVAACPVPVVSAVGHEVDLTICDLVADLRAATPSAAAEAIVPVLADVRAEVRALADALRTAGLWHVERAAERLAGARRSWPRARPGSPSDGVPPSRCSPGGCTRSAPSPRWDAAMPWRAGSTGRRCRAWPTSRPAGRSRCWCAMARCTRCRSRSNRRPERSVVPSSPVPWPMSFEATLTRLQEIVDELEHDELELDRALSLFEEGVSRLRDASADLSRAEAHVKLLVEKTDGTFELPPLDG